MDTHTHQTHLIRHMETCATYTPPPTIHKSNTQTQTNNTHTDRLTSEHTHYHIYSHILTLVTYTYKTIDTYNILKLTHYPASQLHYVNTYGYTQRKYKRIHTYWHIYGHTHWHIHIYRQTHTLTILHTNLLSFPQTVTFIHKYTKLSHTSSNCHT